MSATLPFSRILIIGCSGSGKSTLTRQLAERTGLPIIHLDKEYFAPGWQEPTTEVWRSRVTELVAREAWIMDGNFSGTFDLRMPRTEAVVFLNQPTWRCLWRVIVRTIRHYGKVRPGSAPGCAERFDLPFLHYVLMYNRTRRPGILRQLAQQRDAGKLVYELRSSREIKEFLTDY